MLIKSLYLRVNFKTIIMTSKLLYLLCSNETLLKDATNKELLDGYKKECIKELYNRAKNPNHVKEQLDKITSES